MTNATFHKLCYEFDLNYKYNDEFQKYVDSNYKSWIDSIYNCIQFETQDMKTARDYWRKNYKKIAPNYPWLKDSVEVNEWIDNMPFGGYPV